jgi:polar amino acid transport system substrate-binding protein
MPRRRRAPVLALWAIALLAAAAATSALACTRTVRWELQPPYGVRLPDGERAGYYTDVAREALARIGCTAVLVDMPWARGLSELEAGRLDLVPGVLASAERPRIALFSRPINLSPNLLVLSPAAARRHVLPDLRALVDTRLKIAIETGARYSDEYAALLDDPRFVDRLHVVPDRERAWRMLATGRVDGVIADEASALVAGVRRQPGPGDARPVLVLSAVPARIALSRQGHDAAFVARFDAALDAMVADGTMARLRERYVPCPTDPETLGCRAVATPPDAGPR